MLPRSHRAGAFQLENVMTVNSVVPLWSSRTVRASSRPRVSFGSSTSLWKRGPASAAKAMATTAAAIRNRSAVWSASRLTRARSDRATGSPSTR